MHTVECTVRVTLPMEDQGTGPSGAVQVIEAFIAVRDVTLHEGLAPVLSDQNNGGLWLLLIC